MVGVRPWRARAEHDDARARSALRTTRRRLHHSNYRRRAHERHAAHRPSRCDTDGSIRVVARCPIVAQKVKEKDSDSFGYNAATDKYEDLVKAGVIDPTKVVRSALKNAASIASLLPSSFTAGIAGSDVDLSSDQRLEGDQKGGCPRHSWPRVVDARRMRF
jgi:hypothetical protein